MSDFEGADAGPRSHCPGSCSLEPVTNAEKGALSSSVTCERFGAGVAQSLLPAVSTTVFPSPPSNLLGETVLAADAIAGMANSATAQAAMAIRRRGVWALRLILSLLTGAETFPPARVPCGISRGNGSRGPFRDDLPQRPARPRSVCIIDVWPGSGRPPRAHSQRLS